MHEALLELDNLRLNFNQTSLLILNITIGLIMFGVALNIKTENFSDLLKSPKPVIIGFLSQFFILPFMTFFLVMIIKPTPSVALGMILVSSCPGGNISNFLSSLGKANTELSVSLTAIATIAAIFLTPLNFSFWGGLFVNLYNSAGAGEYLRPLEIDVWQVFQTVFILLGLPVLLGIFVQKRFPGFTIKSNKVIRNISILIFFAIVIILLGVNFDYFLRYIQVIIFIVLLHNAIALFSGYIFSSLNNIAGNDRRAITIETGIQNSGLALALIFNPKIFPQSMQLGGMAFIAAWWGVWHIIAGFIIAYYWRRKVVS